MQHLLSTDVLKSTGGGGGGDISFVSADCTKHNPVTNEVWSEMVLEIG